MSTFYFLVSKSTVKGLEHDQDFSDVKDVVIYSVEGCLETTLTNVINKVGMQGGYYKLDGDLLEIPLSSDFFSFFVVNKV